jgi:membrane protein implicated in regulation of membrane protease activity
MSGSSQAARSGPPPAVWAVVAVVLAVPIVVPLLVPIYAKDSPELAGFPFYYWFQFAMIPAASLLTYLAYRLSVRESRDPDASERQVGRDG